MPQPTPSDVHVDAILTNLSVAYIQRAEAFIASRIFPVIPVEKQSDKYYTYTKGDWFRDEARRRAPATESAGSGYGLSTASYSCDVWALHKDIPDQVRYNADAPINLDREATQFLAQRMMLRLEKQWVSDYFGTGIWATDKTGGTDFTKWSDYAASDPVTNIEDAKETMLSTTGYMPNTLVLGYQVFRQLKNHPDIIDRFKYTSAQNITAELLARVFEVDRILIATAIENTAREGAAVSMAFTHGKKALLCYVAPSPGLLQPSAGYTFSWRGVSRGLGADVSVKRIRMEEIESDRLETQMAWDNKVVATDLGYFFDTAVA